MIVPDKAVHTLTDHAEAFLDNFFEASSDGHDFSNRFHAGTDTAGNSGKFCQVPAGNLTDHIIQLRSDVCRVGCTHFADFIEGATKASGYPVAFDASAEERLRRALTSMIR